jgi:hypothetical protein
MYWRSFVGRDAGMRSVYRVLLGGPDDDRLRRLAWLGRGAI